MQSCNEIDELASLEVLNKTILEGKYICKNFELINNLCNKIDFIYCTLYFKYFSLYIKKNKTELKIKINAVAISKDLINFLNNLPIEVDELVISNLILKETLTNLPTNLKKMTIINYTDNDYFILECLKKYKLPLDIKIILKKNNSEKKLVIIDNYKYSVKLLY